MREGNLVSRRDHVSEFSGYRELAVDLAPWIRNDLVHFIAANRDLALPHCSTEAAPCRPPIPESTAAIRISKIRLAYLD